jgi:hypothetical protein
MNIEKKIEALLLEYYQIMPSVGTWPFTVMPLAGEQFEGLSIKPLLGSQIQLIILKRTDFGPADLVDYLINSKEYGNIPPERRLGFLNSYKHRLQDDKEMSRWCEQLISLSIGITMELFRRNEMEIRLVLAELAEVDSHFGFHCKNLQTYQLFDVIQLHDAETR